MTTLEDFLAAALGEEGYIEQPTNRTKFAAEAGHANGAAWCQTFCVAMAKRTHLELPAGVAETAYTPSAVTAWKKASRWFTDPKPGDWVYFQFDQDPQVDHVGIVAKVNPDGSIQTVEGNTSAGDHGSQSNGGQVAARHRARRLCAGFGRPIYATTPAAAPRPSKEDDMTMTVIVPWVPRRPNGRLAFLEVINTPGANEATVVSYNDAPFTPPYDDKRTGDDPLFGFWSRKLTGLTGPATGIAVAPDGQSVVVTCRGGGTYDVARKPAA